MAFQYAYSLDGDGGNVVKDFPLDTTANYKTSGTNGVTKGDLVFLSSGLLRRAGVAATTASTVGIIEGQEFQGLAQGGIYAATNSSFTAKVTDTTNYPNGIGKVRADKTAVVYRVPVSQTGTTQTATNANIGSQYAIAVDANGDQTIDLNNTAGSTLLVKIIDFDKATGKTVFVTLV